MSVEPPTAVELEVRRIDALVREHGSCLMKESELKRVFADGDGSRPLARLARLAHEHQWSFEFQPHDGTVRIALLPAIQANGQDGDGNNGSL
jgi:hypothetical protein